MTSGKGDDKSPRKRTIEFDWFVRDLEPDKDDNIRGGGEKTLILQYARLEPAG